MSRSIKEDYYWRLVMADKDKSTSKPQERPQTDKPDERKPFKPQPQGDVDQPAKNPPPPPPNPGGGD